MKNSDVIYQVIIKNINLKFCRNYTPYIEIVAETQDENKLTLSSCYYFTNKSKYIVYNELISLLKKYNILINDDNLFDSLKLLEGKLAYLVKMSEFESKYEIITDYKETSNMKRN